MTDQDVRPEGEELTERMEFAAVGTSAKKYPWEIWMNPDNAGKQWKLVPGVHFQCAIQAMMHAIRKKAMKRGIRFGIHQVKGEGDDKFLVIENKGPVPAAE